jgi:hypothetical protein
MSVSITMIAPAGITGVVQGQGVAYTIGSDGTITGVASADVVALLRAGFRFVTSFVHKVCFGSPVPADLTTTVNAVTPSNVALTIAAQPPQARKQQVRIVIGTTTTTAITAGTLTLVGVDQDGNAVTEVVSLVQNASATLKSANAYAKLTSATVAGYVASGSGTGNTIGLGPSNDFGIPTAIGVVDFALVKATKVTKVLGTSNVAADDVAATATVDTVARTVAPTTNPAANGLVDFEFTCSFSVPA